MINDLIHKVRRDIGIEVWDELFVLFKEMRRTKDASVWNVALVPYYEKAVLEERERDVREARERKFSVIEARRQKLVKDIKPATTEITEIVRSLTSPVIRRRKENGQNGQNGHTPTQR